MTPTEHDLLKFINKSPQVQSLLYDLDLLPEQLKREDREWGEMLLIVATIKTLMDEIEGLQSDFVDMAHFRCPACGMSGIIPSLQTL